MLLSMGRGTVRHALATEPQQQQLTHIEFVIGVQSLSVVWGLARWLISKEPACQCRRL